MRYDIEGRRSECLLNNNWISTYLTFNYQQSVPDMPIAPHICSSGLNAINRLSNRLLFKLRNEFLQLWSLASRNSTESTIARRVPYCKKLDGAFRF